LPWVCLMSPPDRWVPFGGTSASSSPRRLNPENLKRSTKSERHL